MPFRLLTFSACLALTARVAMAQSPAVAPKPDKPRDTLRGAVEAALGQCGIPKKAKALISDSLVAKTAPSTGLSITVAKSPFDLFASISTTRLPPELASTAKYTMALPLTALWLPTAAALPNNFDSSLTCNTVFELALSLSIDAKIAELKTSIAARRKDKSRARWAWGRIYSPLWRRLDSGDPRARHAALLRLWDFLSTHWRTSAPPTLMATEYFEGYYSALWTQVNWTGNFQAQATQSASIFFFEDDLSTEMRKDMQGGMTSLASQFAYSSYNWKDLPAPLNIQSELGGASAITSTKNPSDPWAADGQEFRDIRFLNWVEEDLCKSDRWTIVPPANWTVTADINWDAQASRCRSVARFRLPSTLFVTSQASVIRRQLPYSYKIQYKARVNNVALDVSVSDFVTLTADLGVVVTRAEEVVQVAQAVPKWRLEIAAVDPFGRLDTKGIASVIATSKCTAWDVTGTRPSLAGTIVSVDIEATLKSGYTKAGGDQREDCTISLALQLPLPGGRFVDRQEEVSLRLPAAVQSPAPSAIQLPSLPGAAASQPAQPTPAPAP